MKKISYSRLSAIAGVIWVALGTISWLSASVTYIRIVQYAGISLFLNSMLLLILSYVCHSTRKEKKWIMIDGAIDFTFALVLVLNQAFSLFFFPFLLCSWMAMKGLLKMLETLSLAHTLKDLNGDFLLGFFLILFAAGIPHDPIGRPKGITLLVAIIGWTLGFLYLYDSLRAHRQTNRIIRQAHYDSPSADQL